MCCNKENDYLIVSPIKKGAIYTYRQFRDYIKKHGITATIYADKLTMLVSSNGFHGNIRFVSERDFYVASVGFRGLVLSAFDVEEWLRAAEEYEKEEEK